MQSEEKTFLINYKPVLMGAISYLVVFLLPFMYGGFDGIEFMFIPLIVMGITVYAFAKQFKFYSLKISDDEVKAKPWFADEKVLFRAENIKSLMLRKGETASNFEVVVDTSEGNESYVLYTFAYRLNGSDAKESTTQMTTLLESMVDESKRHVSVIEPLPKPTKSMSLFTRFFIYTGLLVFIAMFYVDMRVIAGIHFDTMNFVLPTVAIVFITSLVVFAILRAIKEKHVYSTTLIAGLILGLLFANVAKSYIHWSNENNNNLQVKNYSMTLDDYDTQKKEQRWLLSSEAKDILQRDRFYIYNNGFRNTQINTKLEENKTYSIPVAVGKFNDIFLPKDAFLKAKQIND